MYSLDNIQFRYPSITGLKTRIAQVGEGPVVLFLHGWPESWYSWRLQMIAVANAGYRAIAPDMPGFAGTEARPNIEDYHILNTSEFVLGVIKEVTGSSGPVILVAHDWGAANAWHYVLLHPETVSKLVTMSVPLRRVTERPPMEVIAKLNEGRFFYQLYFQKPGVAEAEFEADPRAILTRLYASPDTPRKEAKLRKAPPEEGGWTDRLGEPTEKPDWIAQADIDYFVNEFTRTGFAGGINYYRNIDRNWELMAPYNDNKVECPVLFLAGSEDMTLFRQDEEQLAEMMQARVPDLRVKLYPGYGHWIQQELPEAVNADMLEFIKN